MHTEREKEIQLEISKTIDAIVNGGTHPLTAKSYLYNLLTTPQDKPSSEAAEGKVAKEYAERVCSGDFPITYTREQVVKHTASDYQAGIDYFKKYVLDVLKENAEASKNLVDEDKVRSAQDIVNETYEDLIFIIGGVGLKTKATHSIAKVMSIVYWNNARNMTQEEFTNWLTK